MTRPSGYSGQALCLSLFFCGVLLAAQLPEVWGGLAQGASAAAGIAMMLAYGLPVQVIAAALVGFAGWVAGAGWQGLVNAGVYSGQVLIAAAVLRHTGVLTRQDLLHRIQAGGGFTQLLAAVTGGAALAGGLGLVLLQSSPLAMLHAAMLPQYLSGNFFGALALLPVCSALTRSGVPGVRNWPTLGVTVLLGACAVFVAAIHGESPAIQLLVVVGTSTPVVMGAALVLPVQVALLGVVLFGAILLGAQELSAVVPLVPWEAVSGLHALLVLVIAGVASEWRLSRKKASDNRKRTASLASANPDYVLVVDAAGRVVSVQRPAFASESHLPQLQPGVVLSELLSDADYSRLSAALTAVLHGQKSAPVPVEMPDIAHVAHLEARLARLEEGAALVFLRDMTTWKQEQLRVTHEASHDGLTGLPNRSAFNQHLEKALARARRNQMALAVLFIDLDKFKQVNDLLGHAAGDEVLVQVGARLTQCLRTADIAARLGGDEFTVIVEGLSSSDQLNVVATKVLAALNLPYFTDPAAPQPTASIGVAIYPSDAEDAALLVQRADEAMYGAKKAGRAGVFYWSNPENLRKNL